MLRKAESLRAAAFGAVVAMGISSGVSSAAIVAGTYTFQDSLAANEGGDPSLVAVDPQSAASFQSASVFGSSRTVYQWGGTASPPIDQGGLTLDTTSLISDKTSYSAEMVFSFFDRSNNWRRILDVQNRVSDSGLYVNPSNNLEVFPDVGSATAWTNNAFHYVVLTDNAGTFTAYLDGVQQLTDPIPQMNINNANNPGNLLGLFIDNTQAGGQGEWSAGQIALFRISNGALTSGEVAALGTDPFVGTSPPPPSPPPPPPTTSGVPLPAAVWPGIGMLAILGLAQFRRVRRQCTA
jgi:hypothetical protein